MLKIPPFLVVTLACLLAAGNASAASAGQAACAWSKPGHDPFMGDVVAAIDRYQDIPAPVRQKLKARMARRAYDEIVSIRRDGIAGRARYGAEIRDMHFGAGQVCARVDRSAWAAGAQERGLVYCEDKHCILVPTVCRNVSRISREGTAVAGVRAEDVDDPPAAGGGGGAGAPGGGAAAPAGSKAAANAPGSFADGASPDSPAGESPVHSAGGGLAPASGAGPVQAGSAGAPVGAPSPAVTPAAPGGSWADLAGGVSVASTGASSGGDGGAPSRPPLNTADPDTGLADIGGLPGLIWPGAPPSGAGQPPLLAQPVPEPGSWGLLLGGLLGLGWHLRRRGGAARISPA